MAQLTLTQTRISASARLARLSVLALLALTVAFQFLYSQPRGTGLHDFGAFIESGRAASIGQNPYGVYPMTGRIVRDGITYFGINLNPPILLPLFEILAHLDTSLAFHLWYGVSLGSMALLLVCVFRAYAPTPLRLAWTLSLCGLWDTLRLGQIYVPLALLAVSAWLLLRDKRWLAAGVLVGLLVAIKPQFIIWPILLLLAGHWRVAFPAMGTTAVASLLPLLRYGPNVYLQWLDALPLIPGSFLINNPSLDSMTVRWGVPSLGLSAGVLLVAVLALWAWRRRPAVLPLTTLALTATVLAAPVMWMGYTLVLVPAFLHYRPTRPLLVAAGLLCVPVPALFLLAAPSPLHLAVFGTLYPLGLVLALVGVWRQVR